MLYDYPLPPRRRRCTAAWSGETRRRCQHYAPLAPKLLTKTTALNALEIKTRRPTFLSLGGDSGNLAAKALVGLCKSRVYFCRLRLIKRNTGRRPVRLKWYKNQQQLRHSGATARIWPISSDTTGQVYVAATARALPKQLHEQPRRIERHMWVPMACAARAARLNGAHCAGALALRSLNR